MGGSASAATLTVNSLANTNVNDTSLTLREAVLIAHGQFGRSLSAGETAQVTGGVAGSGTDTIQFANGLAGTIMLGSVLTLPAASGVLTINGPGASVIAVSGGNATRLFTVNSGRTVIINGFSLINGNSSAGGAIFSSGR